MSGSQGSRLELIQDIPETRAETSPPPRAVSSPSQQALFTMLQAIAAILAIRLLLLIVLGGAIGLGVMAMQRESNQALWTLGAYGLLVVLPMVWLELNSRRRS